MKKRILKFTSLIIVTLSILLCSCKSNSVIISDSTANEPEVSPSSYKAVFVQYDNSYRENEMREAFISRMRLLGYDEIKLKTDVKNAQCDVNRLFDIINSLKDSDYDLIVTIGTQATVQVSKANLKIPCVFIGAEDPVENGIVSDAEAPDNNMTGTVMNTSDKKTTSLIRIFTPEVKTVGVMVSADNESAVKKAESFQITAKSEGISAEIYKVENSDEIEETAVDVIAKSDAVFIPDDAKLNYAMEKIVEHCAVEKKFVFASSTTAVSAGALAAYCSSSEELSNNAAVIADEILKGKKPSEIPVDFSVEGNIFLSSKTYSRLGIGVPDIEGLVVI